MDFIYLYIIIHTQSGGEQLPKSIHMCIKCEYKHIKQKNIPINLYS